MRVRLFTNILRAGSVARDYVRLATSKHDRTATGVEGPKGGEAQRVLESFQDADKAEYELDINIGGNDLIRLLDTDLECMGLVPYHLTKSAAKAGEAISVGSCASIPGDDRKFKVYSISRRYGAVGILDAQGNKYLVPWQLPRPWSD
jgi:hypothetical protein